MGLETTTTITGMNPLWPLGTDPRSEGDNHIRILKSVLQNRFDDATAGTLKLKAVSSVEVYDAGIKRGTFYGGTAGTALIGVIGSDNTGTRKVEIRADAGGFNHYGDGGAGDIWWQSLALNGTNKFRIAYVQASAYTELVSFNASGTRVGNIGLDAVSFYSSSRIIQWNPIKISTEISHYDWYGPDAGLRRVVDPNGNVFTQKVNAAINSFVNYHIINATSRANTFIADVLSDTGGFVTSTFGKGIHVAAAGGFGVLSGNNYDGAGVGTTPRNNVELATWWGFGIKDYSGNVNWSVDARTGRTTQSGDLQFATGVAMYLDGNIKFGGTMANFGTYLSDALGQRAVINTQTATGATGFPMGTVLIMYTNGVQVVRNSLTNPCVSNNDSIYYRLQGQANAGTRLDGNWRACGHIDSNWVMVQRVP